MNTPSAAQQAADAAAAIRRAADGATEKLSVLRTELAARDAELERLREVCVQRGDAIDELTGHAETYRRAAEERAGLVAVLDSEVTRLRGELEHAARERRDAIAEAESAQRALEDERARARFELQQRDAELRAANRAADEAGARLPVFEDALGARARLIAELQATCEERMAVIERLSDEVVMLRGVAEERALVIETNEAIFKTRHTELAEEAERRAVLLAEVTAALEGRTREIDDLRKRLARVS